jgi:hypothetical protein
MVGKRVALALLLLTTASAAQEMQQPVNCPAAAVAPLPPALSAWTAKTVVTSATDESGLTRAVLVPGKGATVSLHPAREVHYITQSEKPGGSVAHGGLTAFAIAGSSTYQVSLSV